MHLTEDYYLFFYIYSFQICVSIQINKLSAYFIYFFNLKSLHWTDKGIYFRSLISRALSVNIVE